MTENQSNKAENEGQKEAVIQEMVEAQTSDIERGVRDAVQEMMTSPRARPFTVEPVVEHDAPPKRPYKLASGRLFLYEGRVGEMYVISECARAVRIESVGWGTVNVFSPATGTTTGIAPNTEVIPYDPAKHAEFVKKIPKIKIEKEDA